MRLDKFCATMGLGTRSEVKKIIRDQQITVNGQVVKKEDIKIDENKDVVMFNDQRLEYHKYVYYLLNKPSGVVSATSDSMHSTVLDCFDCYLPSDVFPVGRLDIDTEGLLLVSNDGALAHRLLSPKHHVDKTYYVETALPLNEAMIKGLQSSLSYEGDTYLPGIVEVINDITCFLTIQEGKFHQVKRMMKCVGNEVTYLKRIRMGSLCLDENLAVGEYRCLSQVEIEELGGTQ